MKKKETFTAVQNMIELSQITFVSNTRQIFDPAHIQELAESIKDKGLLQAIGVLKLADGTFQGIFGECRFKAFHLLSDEDKKFNQIECKVFENLSKADIIEIQVIENLNRKNITPLEEAEGFKTLIAERNISFKETALIAGKSASFVLQRMKLLDLTENFRTALNQKRMTISDALKVAMLKDSSQDMLWNKRFSDLDEEDAIEVSQQDIKKLMGDLSKASFDREDIGLIEGAGACSLCPFNSSCNTMLFPDMDENSTCSNIACFSAKTDKTFENELMKCVDNKDIVFVAKEYQPTQFTKELEEMGLEVFYYNRFNVMEFEQEMPNIEDFREEFEEGVYEDEEEMNTAFQNAMDEYNEELADFNEEKSTALIKRALCVEGIDKGQYFDVEVLPEHGGSNSYSSSGREQKPTAKALQEKIKVGTATEKDIDNEIERQSVAESRKQELDEEKAMPLIYAVLSEDTGFKTLDTELIKAEKIGLALLLFDGAGYSVQRSLTELAELPDNDTLDLYTKLMETDIEGIDRLIAQFSRTIMVEKLKPSVGQRFSKNGLCAGLTCLVDAYHPEKLQVIKDDIDANRKKRAKKLEENSVSLEAKRIDIKAKSVQTEEAAA